MKRRIFWRTGIGLVAFLALVSRLLGVAHAADPTRVPKLIRSRNQLAHEAFAAYRAGELGLTRDGVSLMTLRTGETRVTIRGTDAKGKELSWKVIGITAARKSPAGPMLIEGDPQLVWEGASWTRGARSYWETPEMIFISTRSTAAT